MRRGQRLINALIGNVKSYFKGRLSGLRAALDGGCLYQHLALRTAARMVRVGEFEQFDGRAIFDYERDEYAVGWAVRRNQDFAASKLGGEISHFKRDVWNVPDEIRDRCVRFETHPLHTEFAFLVADDKDFQVFQVGLPRLRFGGGNSDVMVTAHSFFAPRGSGTNSTLSLPGLKPRSRGGLLRDEVNCTSTLLPFSGCKADRPLKTPPRGSFRCSERDRRVTSYFFC